MRKKFILRPLYRLNRSVSAQSRLLPQCNHRRVVHSEDPCLTNPRRYPCRTILLWHRMLRLQSLRSSHLQVLSRDLRSSRHRSPSRRMNRSCSRRLLHLPSREHFNINILQVKQPYLRAQSQTFLPLLLLRTYLRLRILLLNLSSLNLLPFGHLLKLSEYHHAPLLSFATVDPHYQERDIQGGRHLHPVPPSKVGVQARQTVMVNQLHLLLC